MFIRGTIVPLATPDDQLGRVSAVEGVFIGASNELGAFESGQAEIAASLERAQELQSPDSGDPATAGATAVCQKPPHYQ